MAGASSSPSGAGSGTAMSGATASSAPAGSSGPPSHGKAAIHSPSSSGAHGLWSRTASSGRTSGAPTSRNVGRTKRRPRTPDQWPVTTRRSGATNAKLSTSNAGRIAGPAAIQKLAGCW